MDTLPKVPPMTSPRITAAARAPCKQASKECGVNEADNWHVYSDMFIADATIAIEAADFALGERSARSLRTEITRHKANISELVRAKQEAEETLVKYRKKFGPLGVAA